MAISRAVGCLGSAPVIEAQRTALQFVWRRQGQSLGPVLNRTSQAATDVGQSNPIGSMRNNEETGHARTQRGDLSETELDWAVGAGGESCLYVCSGATGRSTLDAMTTLVASPLR
jgi:hypothetical protein